MADSREWPTAELRRHFDPPPHAPDHVREVREALTKVTEWFGLERPISASDLLSSLYAALPALDAIEAERIDILAERDRLAESERVAWATKRLTIQRADELEAALRKSEERTKERLSAALDGLEHAEQALNQVSRNLLAVTKEATDG